MCIQVLEDVVEHERMHFTFGDIAIDAFNTTEALLTAASEPCDESKRLIPFAQSDPRGI